MSSLETPQSSAKQYPERILHSTIFGCAFGAVIHSPSNFKSGFRSSPNGSGRFTGGIRSLCMNVPKRAGSLGFRTGFLHAAEYAMYLLRQKEDPWNFIIAGIISGAVQKMRHGLGPAFRSALVFGAGAALIGRLEHVE